MPRPPCRRHALPCHGSHPHGLAARQCPALPGHHCVCNPTSASARPSAAAAAVSLCGGGHVGVLDHQQHKVLLCSSGRVAGRRGQAAAVMVEAWEGEGDGELACQPGAQHKWSLTLPVVPMCARMHHTAQIKRLLHDLFAGP